MNAKLDPMLDTLHEKLKGNNILQEDPTSHLWSNLKQLLVLSKYEYSWGASASHFHYCVYLEKRKGNKNKIKTLHCYRILMQCIGEKRVRVRDATPDNLLPSMASFFSWQLEQRKGPSHGRNFPGFNEPECIETPSPGFISTWQTAHMNNLNMLQSGYFVSNLHSTKTIPMSKRY